MEKYEKASLFLFIWSTGYFVINVKLLVSSVDKLALKYMYNRPWKCIVRSDIVIRVAWECKVALDKREY